MNCYKKIRLVVYVFLILIFSGCANFFGISLRGSDKSIYYAYLATGDYENIKEILATYHVVNLRSAGGISPLMVSSWFGHTNVVNLLIENEANINASSYKGLNSINLSIMASHVDIFEILFQCGANIEKEDSLGNVAISYAAQNSNMIFLEKLISRNNTTAYINHKNDKDLTPLHLAVINNNYDAVVMLIETGADINCVDEKNASPLFLALALEKEEIIQFLLSKQPKKHEKTDWDIGVNDLISSIVL